MPRWMRPLLWALYALLMVLPLASAAVLWLAIEQEPLVTQTPALSPDDIARARELLRRNDPRGALPGITRAALLSQRDLELLANQASLRLLGEGREGRVRVRLQPGLAVVQASLALPATPLGGWLNGQAVLRQTEALPTVERLRLGRLPVPAWLAEAALPRLLTALDLRAPGELAQRLVSRVAFGPQQVALAYAWPDNPRQALSDTLMPADEQARLKVHVTHLAALTADGTLSGTQAAPLPLGRLLAPVFTLARQRSTDAESAARENRAALVALAFLVSEQPLTRLLPAAQGWPQPRPLVVTLAGRVDTAQHFLVSALLAAEAGGPLADAIGLYKEVADSRGGSGFSFNDLAADRAGTRLGQLAARSPRLLQARLAAPLGDEALMPPVADLSESMPEREFKRRYGGVGGAAYQRVMADIEARLDALPLLAPPP